MEKTHTQHTIHTSHTQHTKHTHKHNVQNIYSDQSACAGCSAVVSPLALGQLPTPRVTPSPPMEHKTPQGKQPRQEIHPLPEEQDALFSCFPPASRDLGRSQGWLWATSSAQLGARESRGAALATRFPFLRKKNHP